MSKRWQFILEFKKSKQNLIGTCIREGKKSAARKEHTVSGAKVLAFND
jgi:hypothetical protein